LKKSTLRRKKPAPRSARTDERRGPARKAVPGPGAEVATRAGPCIVGVGASAGGLAAIRELLGAMPADSGMAFVVIQHLDPERKSLSSELLGKCTSMPVTQAEDGIRVAPDRVYTNPPDKYLSLADGKLRLARLPQPRQQRLPIDHFFRSLGEDQHERAIGIVLSGSGADGAFGIRTIVENGGMVIAQQPETAQFDGIPHSAIQTGLVSAVLPIAKMPQALIAYAGHPYAAGARLFAGPPGSDAASLGRIMEHVRSRSGFDFAGYKLGTLQRRIQRRMGLRGIKRAADYARVVKAEPPEGDALFKDLLIGVTEFFRDPAAWSALDTEAIKPLVAGKTPGEPIRVWVAGAATGEEAYSIAMLLDERLEEAGKKCTVQIFATDTNEDALAIARNAVYPAGIAARVSAERLRRFFVEKKDDHHYRVQDALRQQVVFAPHNLLRDPAYSKMDLVSCRNLLIYLEPELQRKVVVMMHFALRSGGYLFLGAAESVATHEDLFAPVSKKWRIFRRLDAIPREPIALPIAAGKYGAAAGHAPAEAMLRTVEAAPLVQRLLVDRFAPAAVLTNARFDALYFCGPTDRFLVQPKGEPTQNLLALAREGLRSRLRSAINEAQATGSTVVITDAQVRRANAFEPVKLTVVPAMRIRDQGELLLAVFEDTPKPAAAKLDGDAAAARIVQHLEEELKATKEDLQSTIERHAGSVASHEEVVAANEELQSMNEELESSKEELQSLNEELNTVNQQLQSKIAELETAESNLNNLLESSEIATVCLDRNFRIKWFSPGAGALFGLVASDVGRRVQRIRGYAF
jgi:two-component system, chemotaxis family, CheB/CheR fusion protein